MRHPVRSSASFSLPRKASLPGNPPPGKVTHVSGLFWRDFYWESTLPDGSKTQRPIEVFGKPETL
jgi:hypothetical protein